MTRLFRSKSCGLVELNFNPSPPSPFFHNAKGEEEDEEEEEEEEEELYNDDADDDWSNPASTPFINPGSKRGGGSSGVDNKGWRGQSQSQSHQNQFAILDILMAALKKSLVTCSVERDDVCSSSLDIGLPTEVRHVSHVTFDRFNGFLGLPSELQPEVPRRVPSARSTLSSSLFTLLFFLFSSYLTNL